jgi:signal recognition particle GTPase
VDQLEEWTKRSGVDIHRPSEGQTKPMPVLDDAITKAINGNYDVVRGGEAGHTASAWV